MTITVLAGLAIVAPAAAGTMAAGTMTRDIAHACVRGDAVAAPLLAARLREGTGVIACDPAAPPVTMMRRGRGQGFAIRTSRTGTRVIATDTRGLVQGAGWLLRHATIGPGRADVAIPARLTTRPVLPVRMTQIGYRAKNNSYDAWTPAMFARRLEDMALWGASGVQVIAPVSDDAATSPLFPQPPVETLAAIGTAAHRLGLDFALYYPVLGDYPDAAAIMRETAALDALLARLPRVDALYVPGGDPGHTAPPRLFPLVEEAAATLRRRHPAASVWISTQGFDAAGLTAFYSELDRAPRWLTGVFAGPQTRDPVAVQRARIPARYRLLLYPDIAHTMHAQFPVPGWYPEFALTEGREPINPQPAAQALIARHFAGLHTGFVTYSEGVSDDFNQFLWFRLGWGDAQDAAGDYARMFIGDPRATALPALLEANWRGNPAANIAIDATLAAADAIRPGVQADWRLDSLRYRAVYDAVVRHRTIAARSRQAAAMAALARGDAAGARAALARPDGAAVAALRRRLDTLADRLFAIARLQLSVSRFGASHVERGANLDRADVNLDDCVALTRAMATAPVPSALADHARHGEGALYDDLGNPAAEPHLVRGIGGARDPQMFATAIDGIADRTPQDGWSMAAITYAESLYDAPLRLHYDRLDPGRGYRLVATYAGEDYALPMRLVADGRFVLHASLPRTTNPMTVEVAIPRAATADGRLDLAWTRPPGMGGSGRGHQVAETWLILDPQDPIPSGVSR